MTSRLTARTCDAVPSSSFSIIDEKPTTSAARIAARRRVVIRAAQRDEAPPHSVHSGPARRGQGSVAGSTRATREQAYAPVASRSEHAPSCLLARWRRQQSEPPKRYRGALEALSRPKRRLRRTSRRESARAPFPIKCGSAKGQAG